MSAERDRPLFSQVGRATAPTDVRARGFQLMIALGLVFAGLMFLAELGSTARRRLITAEVDLTVRPEP